MTLIVAADRIAHRPKEVEEALGIGHTTFYKLVKEGRLDLRKIGRISVVVNLREFIANLPKAD